MPKAEKKTRLKPPVSKNIKARLMDAAEMNRALRRIAQQIIENNKNLKNTVLVGILTRGVPLAERLAALIRKSEKFSCPLGSLDIALYRDDLASRGKFVEVRRCDIPFDINSKFVVLVDDVLFSGRTIRAALDSLSDYGRPAAVRLACLIDRGHRELPIQADFIGKKVQTSKQEEVKVNLREIDGLDQVIVRPGRG